MRLLLSLGALLAGACTVSLPGPPMPTTFAEVDAAQVAAWSETTAIASPSFVRFRWRLQTSEGAAWRRGWARMLPGDSMRFDLRFPLGMGQVAAAVIGDTAMWAEPEEEVRKIVPSFPLLWAMLGRIRPPEPGVTLRGFHDERVQAWRVIEGTDTTEYLLQSSPRRELVADVRSGGRRIGRVHTVFDTDGKLLKSRLDIPQESARLELEYYGHTAIDGMADSLWVRPSDAP